MSLDYSQMTSLQHDFITLSLFISISKKVGVARLNKVYKVIMTLNFVQCYN